MRSARSARPRVAAARGSVLAALVLVAGCAEAPDTAQAESDTAAAVIDEEARALADTAVADTIGANAQLEGPTWVLESVLDLPVEASSGATLHFDRETTRVSGDTGCNAFSGSYEVVGTSMRFGALGMTRMACPQGLDRQEAHVVEALRITGSFEVRGDVLELLSENGVVARYRVGGDG